nr:immunoglobulin heavy chain junction region [Mus musculus]
CARWDSPYWFFDVW